MGAVVSTPARSRLRLSPHFLLCEFASGDGAPFPAAVVDNLRRVATMLEVLRATVAFPLIITSGYRSSAWNRRVGGVPRSYHLLGLAADVITREAPSHVVQEAALRLQHRVRALGGIGGVGCYPGFTHVDLGPVRTWTGEPGRLALGGRGHTKT